jgi:hypothetical protein
MWKKKQEKAFGKIKRALTNVPALGLPDVKKPFFLYVQEGDSYQDLHLATGLLALFSGLLVQISQCRCLCLYGLAATTALVAEADKLALGQELTVQVPHSVLTLMEYKGTHWLTSSQMVNTRVCFVKTHTSGYRLLEF